jgi:aminopeptidase-like protein
VLLHSQRQFKTLDFTPYGYDERQYCSPGINLPVGCFMRTPNGQYPEYHTSADNLSFVSAQGLAESLKLLVEIIQVLEENVSFLNLNPKCEPQLGRRGLYRQTGGAKDATLDEIALLWVLNLSDGQHNLLDIALRSGIAFHRVTAAADALREAGLLASA